MREILFRGKKIDTGVWRYGYLFKHMSSLCIGWEHGIECDYEDGGLCEHTYDFVDPNTVGQYIGLEDVTDRKIFEGDIVKMFYAHTKDERGVGVIASDSCVLVNGLGRMFTQDIFDFKVIGNIHDNPELLEVGNA